MMGRIGGTLFFIIHYDENFVFILYEQCFNLLAEERASSSWRVVHFLTR